MLRLLKQAAWLASTLGVVLIASCNRGTQEVSRALDLESFIPQYNRYIEEWVRSQRDATLAEIAELESNLTTADGEKRELMETQLGSLRRDMEKWDYRLSIGGYFREGNPDEIPGDLVWENGLEQPEIGDPRATKGGVLRQYFLGLTYPPTLRPIGDNANHMFRGNLYDDIELPLVSLHPDTMAEIPGVAKEWAESKDGRTLYIRIDPEATYSDGVPIKARDYLVTVYLYVSDNIVNPYAKQYFREEFAQIATLDDRTLAVSLPEPKVFLAGYAGGLRPSAPHFYSEYGPDYTERYQWRFPPTTGAYEVLEDDIVKGSSITQTRVKDWWAKDRKYYQYRYNPDKIVTTLVRDESKAFELFRAGEIDTFIVTRPEFWYEKSEMQPVYDGYIRRATVYNTYPKIPRGLYLNVTKPLLDDRDVRIGIQYAMNWQKVIDVMFRGDYQRLNAFNEGFELFSDPTIRARPFSIGEAREAFQKAGFTQEGSDGILMKPDGTRLSLSVTYAAMPLIDRMMAILREEARACGFDLRLDGLEATVSYRKQMQKQHEMVLGAWNTSLPIPDFHQFLHSTNAFDNKGNPKPQTNNTFVWARPDTDKLSEQLRNAKSLEELADAAAKLQRIMHDEAIFVPGYSTDFMRIAYWRWIRWPDSEFTPFSPRYVYDPHEIHVLWVDEEMKQETMAARRSGKTFPEYNRVFRPLERGEPEPETETETESESESESESETETESEIEAETEPMPTEEVGEP